MDNNTNNNVVPNNGQLQPNTTTNNGSVGVTPQPSPVAPVQPAPVQLTPVAPTQPVQPAPVQPVQTAPVQPSQPMQAASPVQPTPVQPTPQADVVSNADMRRTEDNDSTKNKYKFLIPVVFVVAIVLLVGYIIVTKVNSNKNNNSNSSAQTTTQKQEEKKEEQKEDKKDNDKSNDNDEEKEIGIGTETVKNLAYPEINASPCIFVDGKELDGFCLKKEEVSDYSTETKILGIKYESTDISYASCSDGSKTCDLPDKEEWTQKLQTNTTYFIVPGETIKKSFRKIYGPDANFENKTLNSSDSCHKINKYDSKSNSFYGVEDCIESFNTKVGSLNKTYKAVRKNDYLYVYDYAYIYYYNNETGKYCMLDIYEENIDPSKECKFEFGSKEEVQEKFDYLVKYNKTKTYKWTFKKQSDGKYYYYSGEWEKD